VTYSSRTLRGLFPLLFLSTLLVASVPFALGADRAQRWVATWATANVASEHPVTFSNQTIREIVHTTIGGSKVRIRLTNAFGTGAIRFDAVFVGVGGVQEPAAEKRGATLSPGSNREVTFGGSPSITIPEGAEALSDPVSIAVAPEQNLAISLFIAGKSGPATIHEGARQTNYISGAGNFAADEDGGAFTSAKGSKTPGSWYFLSAVEVLGASSTRGAVVALGDSITDGEAARSNKNERWTDVLARRLLADHIEIAVLNAGIDGNRVLTSSTCWGANAVARLRRDVLTQIGIEAVILFEGTNDIGQPDTPGAATNPCMAHAPATADEIISGYKQIIALTRARGLKIFGATILPYQGYEGWTAAGEAKRVAVNRWIRTSGAYDGIIDFDAAVRDAETPNRLAPQFDSGDHLHPGTAGHEAMGNAVDLALFH
jgi:lysophospholipase L1-like esterase